jgi:hypothetical protein
MYSFLNKIAGSSGWNSMRAGTFLLRMIDGKSKGVWDRNENIVHRTIGNPEFEIRVLAMETDFEYTLHVKFQKEGYVLTYEALATTMLALEPGSNWIDEHKSRVTQFTGGKRWKKMR